MPARKNTVSRRPAAPKPEVTTTQAAEGELTDFQQLVCNLAADLIINGGEEQDLEKFLEGIFGHMMHPQFRGDEWWKDRYEDEKLPEWKQRLMRYWPEAASPRTVENAPKTVSDMARENLRDRLRSRCREFRHKARMHELYLLDSVLDTFEATTGGADNPDAESILATAFIYELDSDHAYVKVQRDHLKMVEQYVKLLNEADPEVSRG